MSASLEISQLIQKLATAAASLEISCRPDQLIQKNSENSEHFPNQLASFKTTQLIKTIYSELFSSSKLTKGGHHLKKTVFFGNFSQMADPPPFGNPLVEKFFYGLFCILGHKEQFCFSQKSHFWVVFQLLDLGIGDPPSPLLGKLPKKYRILFLNRIMAIISEYL